MQARTDNGRGPREKNERQAGCRPDPPRRKSIARVRRFRQRELFDRFARSPVKDWSCENDAIPPCPGPNTRRSLRLIWWSGRRWSDRRKAGYSIRKSLLWSRARRVSAKRCCRIDQRVRAATTSSLSAGHFPFASAANTRACICRTSPRTWARSSSTSASRRRLFQAGSTCIRQ